VADFVVVFGAVGGDVDARGAARCARRAAQDQTRRRGERRAAEQSDRGLLIGVERQRGGIVGDCTGDEATVIAPVEAGPRTSFERLILQVRGLVEFFVVVDAEDAAALADGHTESADLRRKVTCSDARHYDERAEAMPVGHAGAQQESRNFGIVPVDRKRDRRVAEHLKSYALCVYFQMYSPSITRWRDVEGTNLRTLVGIADIQAVRSDDVEVVECVRRLKPRACVLEISVDRILLRKLVIDAVKDIFFVAFIVNRLKLRRIEEAAGV
jgi:hypothetical protein